ncbi:MAG TPA: type II secretion system protein M [Gammaproteobacteria bacterium]|nr:type II secretion system protein M [Gammaproteobacteria bacterium]
MRGWWEQLARREQLFLLGGAIVTALLLGYLALWQPLQGSLKDARARRETLEGNLQDMQRIASEVRALRARAHRRKQAAGGNLLSEANNTATGLGLGGALTRVQPQGDKRLRVWFKQAAFNDLLEWLQKMQAQGISVAEVSINRRNQPGLVDARITLERAR